MVKHLVFLGLICVPCFFVVVEGWCGRTAHLRVKTTATILFSSSPVESSSSSMRLSEIKLELQQRKVDYSDCFDKESLVLRLIDSRKNNKHSNDGVHKNCDDSSSSNTYEGKKQETLSNEDLFDRDAALSELKTKTVRELREELGRRRIPRTGLFEKEDIILALVDAREKASVYSATGLLTPGEVSDLNSSNVKKEIDFSGGGLLLVDIYATWCGPCKMLAPILSEIASEEKDNIRIIKMDSDKYPDLATTLKVGGLPTLVMYKGSNEINRLEGAPTKEQLQVWIENNR